MKVCLVNDTSNTSNWGARATSASLRMMLESTGAQLDSVIYESRLTIPQRLDHPALIGTSKWLDKHLPENRLAKRINRGVHNRLARRYKDTVPRTWDDFPRLARQVMEGRALPDVLANLETSDLVMISGEGCLYGNIRQSRMILFIAYLARHELGKNTVIVNHSVDFEHPVLKEMAQQIYPLLDEVIVREPDSADVCAEFCDPTLAADAAYGMPPATGFSWLEVAGRACYFDGQPSRARNFDPREPYVCVGGSSSLLRGGASEKDPLPGYLSLCRELKDAFGQVLLVAASWQDEKILLQVAEKLDLPLLGVTTPFPQAMDAIANSWAYVGGRWHSAIFAQAGGTPVIALGAYTSKMRAFLHHIGQSGEPLDPFELDVTAAQVRERLEDIRSQGETLRRELRECTAELKRLSWLNVRPIKERLVASSA
jgi:polysaccharide pyruvyl transferase WcaK-like protein